MADTEINVSAHDSTPISPYFRGVPVAPDRRCWSQSEHVGYLKLFCREIIFEVFISNVCDNGILINAGTIFRLGEQNWWKNNQDTQIQSITL